MNLQEIKELIRVLDETEISELNLESEGVKISIKKGNNLATGAAPVMTPVSTLAPALSAKETVHSEVQVPVKASSAVAGESINAPMVGTFYRAPGPDAPAFVELGQQIRVGQPVCIIEAMKLMNEIEAEIEGKVVEILVENGQPVEYGQPLFRIEK